MAATEPLKPALRFAPETLLADSWWFVRYRHKNDRTQDTDWNVSQPNGDSGSTATSPENALAVSYFGRHVAFVSSASRCNFLAALAVNARVAAEGVMKKAPATTARRSGPRSSVAARLRRSAHSNVPHPRSSTMNSAKVRSLRVWKTMTFRFDRNLSRSGVACLGSLSQEPPFLEQ